MTTIRALLVGATLVAGSVTTAPAADLYGGSIKDGYVAAPMPVSSPSSWYIRADVGYGAYDRPTMIEEGRFDLDHARINDQWAAGLGVGYYFSKSVRGDLTWDHRFKEDAYGSIPNAGLVDFPGQRHFGLRSDVFLANLYYDFDLRSRFTPYVGLGLGFTRNTTTNGSVPDSPPHPCVCGFQGVTIAGDSKWSVAGALMSGFSYNVRDRLHIDAGYRYLYLGEAHTGLIRGTVIPALGQPGMPAVDGDPAIKDLWVHEFRIGLRYDIR